MSDGEFQEITGDLWDHWGVAVVALTTGGQVNRKGECVMLRGCARQGRDRFPWLARRLGELILLHGNHVHQLGEGLVSFPVEQGPCDPPDLGLIERSCVELVQLADKNHWQRLVLPRPGCGSGGLIWRDVQKILARRLDQRFMVISQER